MSERDVVLIFLPVVASVEVVVVLEDDPLLLTPEFCSVRTGVKLAEGLVPGAC